MLVLTHTFAFLLGFAAAAALGRYVAARVVAEQRRPFRRSRVAIRLSDEDRLWRQVWRGAEALGQLDQLYQARGQRPPLPIHGDPDWIAEINAILGRPDGQEQ